MSTSKRPVLTTSSHHKEPSNPQQSVVMQTPHTMRLLKLVQDGTYEHAQQATQILVRQVGPTLSPTLLWDLIGRLAECCIFHSDWKSRVNASYGVQQMVMLTCSSSDSNDASDTDESSINIIDHQMEELFEKQDNSLTVESILECLGQILAEGTPLYSKSEHDDSVNMSQDDAELLAFDEERLNNNVDNEESAATNDQTDSFLQQRVRMQQSILQRRLGLMGFGRIGIDTDDLIANVVTSRDLLPPDAKGTDEPVAKRRRRIADNNKFDPKLRVLLVLEMEEQLRRRGREESDIQSIRSNQLNDTSSDISNPQSLLASEVIYRMLDPKWEIRHGAALACLGLVRAWYVQQQQQQQHEAAPLTFGAWLQQVMARCLCVLALDRFGDFGLGGVVAPVRESVGQLLSVLVAMAPRNVQECTFHVLFRLVEYHEDWEVRFGALIAFKYIVVLYLKESMTPTSNTNVSDSSCSDAVWCSVLVERIARKASDCLKDKSDDVKGIAAIILVEYILQSPAVPDVAFQAAGPLWRALRSVDNLSSCLSDLSILLSLLIEHDIERVLHELQTGKGLEGLAIEEESLDAVSRFILRLLDSSMASVKHSGMRCINALARPLSDRINQTILHSEDVVAQIGVYTAVLYRVFETFFDNDCETTPNGYECAQTYNELRDRAWTRLSSGSINLLQHSGAQRSIELGLVMRYFGVKSSRSRVSDSFVESTRAAGAFSSFLRAAWKMNEPVLAPVLKLALIVFLRSPWLNHFEAACHLIADIAPIFTATKAFWNIMDELTDYLVSRHPNCLLYDTFASAENLNTLEDAAIIKTCDDAFTNGASLLLDESSSARCEHVAESVSELWSHATGRRFNIADENAKAASFLSMRLNATIAGTIIAVKLPPKLTPIVRALMTSVKNEPDVIKGGSLSCTAKTMTNHSDENLSPRADYTSHSLKKLILSIDRLPATTGTLKKVFESLCELAADDNFIAAFTIQRVVTKWLATLNMSETDVLWSRLQGCGQEGLILGNNDTIRTLKVFEIICGSFDTDSTEMNRLAMERFISPLIDYECNSDSNIQQPSSISIICKLVRINFHGNMRVAIASLAPFLQSQSDNSKRMSACIVLDKLISDAGLSICPFVRSLLPIVLSLLTDSVKVCAGMASKMFACLVRAAPLVQQTESIRIDSMPANDFGEKVIDHLILGKTMPPVLFPRIVLESLKESNTVLREYQREGISWLRFLQSVNLNGALCDSMGLGKTLQALMAIALSHVSNSTGELEKDAMSLVVCPASVVGHFIQEIDKFFPRKRVFRSLCFVGPTHIRRKLWSKMAPDVNLVVTSYSVLRSETNLLASKKWRYCVLDEGHLLCNPRTATARASRTLSARHRLITTGTIIQNGHVNELWATFDFLMPNFLGDIAHFSKTFARPITRGQLPGASADSICESINKLKTLHQQCLPFILRRDKDKVLRELPPKIVSVIPVSMSGLQEKMYATLLSRPRVESVLSELQLMLEGKSVPHSDSSSSGDALRSLLLLRLVCTHPALVSQSEESDFMDLSINASGKLLALVELLRESGIYEDVTSGADNDRSLLFCGADEASDDYESLLNSTMDNYTTSDMRKTEPSKCVIFAQFSKSLDVVERLVLNRLMPTLQYLRFDGQVPAEKRATIADSFNRDPHVKILLSTTRVGGLGLNLTGADMIIFLENSMNPFADMQAAERAHRIGQVRVLNVYNLVTSDSVEEKIMLLQKKKVAVSEAIVNTENSSLYSMGTDRLLDIFTARTNDAASDGAPIDLDALAENLCEEYESLSVEKFLENV
ncbi:hypothetical protein MPSEU_000916000 [Mayamaea pseudoterrestris]|nr:hypothetical protein MPSEU_000916000 [Mayamaea pseudoterrestris]